MGQMIEEIALSRGHEIVSIIDVDNRDDFNTPAFRSAEVAIEFTAPQAAYDNICAAFEQGVKVVSGSTGWIGQYGEEMRQRCWNDGKTLLWSSNFSVGVAIFRALNRRLAQRFGQKRRASGNPAAFCQNETLLAAMGTPLVVQLVPAELMLGQVKADHGTLRKRAAQDCLVCAAQHD